MKQYLSLSEIAKLFNVNRPTLHYYDKIGLFKPEYRDPNNRYRKYSYRQVAQFALIVYLRTIGIPIDKIKAIMNDNDFNQTIQHLRIQSEELKAWYNEIFYYFPAVGGGIALGLPVGKLEKGYAFAAVSRIGSGIFALIAGFLAAGLLTDVNNIVSISAIVTPWLNILPEGALDALLVFAQYILGFGIASAAFVAIILNKIIPDV